MLAAGGWDALLRCHRTETSRVNISGKLRFLVAMVSTCTVPECKDSKRKRLAGVRYHRVRVSCPSLCRRWLKAANNPQYGVNTAMAALKNLRVCGLHFRPEDYERNVLDQSVKSLKESSVPPVQHSPDPAPRHRNKTQV